MANEFNERKASISEPNAIIHYTQGGGRKNMAERSCNSNYQAGDCEIKFPIKGKEKSTPHCCHCPSA